MNDEIPEDMSELYDANVPRVDLVDKAANGLPFLIAKADGSAGLMPPDFVRDLIAKAEPEPAATDPRDTVTMSGSPAAIAALIHGAAVRKAKPAPEPDEAENADEQIAKAKYDADDLKRMAGNGQAMKDESYPIADNEDLTRAIRAVGRGGAEHDAIRRHIISRAKSLGASSEIPDNWGADGSLKKAEAEAAPETTEVTKDMDVPMDDEGGMDPCVVLAEPADDEAPGNPGDPGSPAWEAIDAATARKWTAIAARLRSALGVMSDRESLEAATVDPDDAEAAMDLDDAACAVDFVIDTLAGFAVDEQAEADDAVMAMVGKAMASFDPTHLDTVESLGSIRKAGRALSGANEQALRAAITALQQILASLPKAPDAQAPATGAGIAKEADMADNENTEHALTDRAPLGTPKEPAAAETPAAVPGPDAVAKSEAADEPVSVAKADKPPQVAVYDAQGNLVGVADPADITMIAAAQAPAANTDDDTPDEPAAPAAEAPEPPADLTPAPAASVGTPADAVPADDDTVAKATETTETNEAQEVLKGSIQELVKAAIAEHSAPQGELIKTLEDRNRELEERNEALAKQAAELNERLTKVENQPAVMAIASNGAIPPAHQLRGQDHGASNTALTEGQALRKQLAESDDALEKKAIADRMQELAIARFQEMQQAARAR